MSIWELIARSLAVTLAVSIPGVIFVGAVIFYETDKSQQLWIQESVSRIELWPRK